jgi:hypothetical protein
MTSMDIILLSIAPSMNALNELLREFPKQESLFLNNSHTASWRISFLVIIELPE